MPSLFEPCGLSQLIAMTYGTIPIVRETGGLRDTVVPYNEFTGEGNGFSFANINAHEFLFVTKYACDLYRHNKEVWDNLIEEGMKADYSWRNSAKEYAGLYSFITGISIADEEPEKKSLTEEILDMPVKKPVKKETKKQAAVETKKDVKVVKVEKKEAAPKKSVAKAPAKREVAKTPATKAATPKKAASTKKTTKTKSDKGEK